MTTIPKRTLSHPRCGFTNEHGEFVCTGSQMSRPNRIPSDLLTVTKMRLVRLRWVDYDYDQGGAYWGGGSGDYIYWAYGESETEQAGCFVRCESRVEAKKAVRCTFPNAKFYR